MAHIIKFKANELFAESGEVEIKITGWNRAFLQTRIFIFLVGCARRVTQFPVPVRFNKIFEEKSN